MAKLNYVELPVQSTATAKDFYASAFGWDFTDYGPTYAATGGGPADLGLQGDRAEWTTAPLPVIEVEDLDTTLTAVTSAGGTVTQPIFAFPGGRRFHFRDPSGNELAAMQAAR
ncbi:MAG: VOC family protein [Sphingomonas sp.]|uniref:VOC family protein n=1 Tax=Sphingomonas sp. TaxID=28214 RepID=UPI001ACE1025|nr:VOC family protein [Sphingomonas sp.]MBN8807497.1 VOC family protein [Sphingomonas sp.]